jgi:hypothetical protein
MKKILTYSAIASLVLGLFAWWYYQPKRLLERRLNQLIETLSFDPASTRTSRLLKSSSVGKFFDQHVEITSPIDDANGNFSPEDLNTAYSYLSENAREIVIHRDSTVQTQIDRDYATQEFEADVKVSISRWLQELNGRYFVTVHWRKTTEGWKIHSTTWKKMP